MHKHPFSGGPAIRARDKRVLSLASPRMALGIGPLSRCQRSNGGWLCSRCSFTPKENHQLPTSCMFPDERNSLAVGGEYGGPLLGSP